MADNYTNTSKTKVFIPMVVDLDSIKEHGPICGVSRSQIRQWKIGNRYLPVVLVPGSKEAYDAYMSSLSKEFKSADRDNRCAVSNGHGKLIRCPECNKCSDCDYYYKRNSYGTVLFSDLAVEGNDGEMIDYEAKSPEGYYDGERYIRMLTDLIAHANEINPTYGHVIELLLDRNSRRGVASEMGLAQSTLTDQVARLKPIVIDFLKNIPY